MWSSEPVRLRLLRTVLLLLTTALAALLTAAAFAALGAWDTVADRDTPRTTSAANPNLALNDMDPQVANLLLTNADESRYLLMKDRRGQYQGAFSTKSQNPYGIPGATLATYDQRLDETWGAYRPDHRRVARPACAPTHRGLRRPRRPPPLVAAAMNATEAFRAVTAGHPPAADVDDHIIVVGLA
ncbi:hypothetical protein [Streptomyces flavofungini]|uniref:hypothetical protein n=1 Tax=Streptomyces flavofungini TaxID=68200 RepID=UPI0025AFC4E8|nr:hypothetical protein [Streptomyces flavofungini]WJV50257.1 hypothetical protein QUY26_34955 [Streptomyces flavofungini]